jgi:hypothetical protein
MINNITLSPNLIETFYNSSIYEQFIDNSKNIENFINTVIKSSTNVPTNYYKLSSNDKKFIDSILDYSDYNDKNKFNNFIISEKIDNKRASFYRLLLDYMQSVLIDESYHKYGSYLYNEHRFRLDCIINILISLRINIRISNISDEDMIFYFAYIDEKMNKVNDAIDNYINYSVQDSNLKNKYNYYKNIRLNFRTPNNYLMTYPPSNYLLTPLPSN